MHPNVCKGSFMDKFQAQKYIERLGLDISYASHVPDLTLLNALQYAHVTEVPYENLDILDNIPLKLDEDSLYKKIVENRRGGYCFEVNALLEYLLKALGYKTVNCFARYLRGENKIPMRRHRVIIAESDDLDCRYFVDAGIGERAPRLPLKLLAGVEQEQYGEVYRFEEDESLGWVLWDRHKGEWNRFMSFTEDNQVEEDYLTTSFYCEKHPDSPFNKGNMLSIKTANGRKTVSDNEFRVFDGGDVEVQIIRNKAELNKILAEHFGIMR